MIKKLTINSFLLVITCLLIASCGKSNNDNFDFSNIELPKKTSQKVEKNSIEKNVNKEIINKLIPLKDRNEVAKNIKYGKKDPFALENNESKLLISNFSLKGFVSLNNVDYALVEFLNQSGLININSIGGSNTRLLPNKALVKDINPQNEELKISIEGNEYKINLSMD